MDQATGLTADRIEEIARTIALGVRPRRVILIGSQARGDAGPESDLDLVVEFDDSPESARARGHAVKALFRGRDFGLDVVTRVTGQIEASADDPGTLDWDIVRQGRVLYSATGDYSLGVPPRRVSERRPPASLRDWTDRARYDLDVAKFTVGHGNAWDWVAYLSQQSGEKYLKALLVRSHVRPPRIHNLTELLEALARAGIPLQGVEAECALLSKFAEDSRYGPRRASEAEARGALAAAERVAAIVDRELASD